MIPAWVEPYIGLPFLEHGRSRDGVDCWGLVRLVLAEKFGVCVPSYVDEYTSAADQDEVGRLIRGEMGPWVEVPSDQAAAGDVALLRIKGQPCHVGLVVASGWMLHVEQGIDSVLDRYGGPRWGRRLVGIYRHQNAPASAGFFMPEESAGP